MVVTWWEIEFLRHLELEEQLQKNTVKKWHLGSSAHRIFASHDQPDAVWVPHGFPTTRHSLFPEALRLRFLLLRLRLRFLRLLRLRFLRFFQALKGFGWCRTSALGFWFLEVELLGGSCWESLSAKKNKNHYLVLSKKTHVEPSATLEAKTGFWYFTCPWLVFGWWDFERFLRAFVETSPKWLGSILALKSANSQPPWVNFELWKLQQTTNFYTNSTLLTTCFLFKKKMYQKDHNAKRSKSYSCLWTNPKKGCQLIFRKDK